MVVAASQLFPCHCSSHARCPRLPMCKHAAIQAKGIVVLERNSRANCTFPRSPLRRALRSASLQRIRLRPSTTSRSACATSASCTASPKWLGPGRASTCSSSSLRNSSPPRHQPLSPGPGESGCASGSTHAPASRSFDRPASTSATVAPCARHPRKWPLAGHPDSSHDRLPQDIECALSEPCAGVNTVCPAGSTKHYNLIN